MTKAKAWALAKHVDSHCDEPHIFVAQVGSGCLCDVVSKGDAHTLLSMFFTLVDRTMKVLKRNEQDEFQKLFAAAMKFYLESEFAPAEPEVKNLSDKQRRKIQKSNEKILAAIEGIL